VRHELSEEVRVSKRRASELQAGSGAARIMRAADRMRRRVLQFARETVDKGRATRSRAAKGKATMSMNEALTEKLKADGQSKKEIVASLQAVIAQWEDTCYELEATSYPMQWSVDEMNQWGKVPKDGAERVHYPPEVVMLGMELCANEAMPSQVPSYIKSIMAAFVPHLKDMPVPTPQTIRTWRLGLLPLCDLVSAIKIAQSTYLNPHQDGTSKYGRPPCAKRKNHAIIMG